MIAVVLVVCALVLGATGPAQAAAPVNLSLSISSSVDEVAPGSELGYVVAVQNAGSAAVEARMVVTVPDFSTITAAAGADIDANSATWTLTVEPGVPSELSFSALTSDVPDGEFWMTASVAVYTGEGIDPVVGMVDSVPIAGTEAARSADARAAEDTLAASSTGALFGSSAALTTTIVCGSALVLLLAATALLLSRRKRKQTAAAAGPEER